MESIGPLDMEAGISYGTLQDCSHVSLMGIMEEDVMAAPGPSLLYVLLDVYGQGDEAQGELTAAVNEAKARTKDTKQWPHKAKYGSLEPKQRKQVQARLYDVLYKTIEYAYMPQNEDLNMTIGETLARAINGQQIPQNDRIENLRRILLKAITNAIDDEI
jgi:hypothetical protein